MEEEKLKASGKLSFYIPRRYILCFLLFCGFLTMNCQRSCLSVAIVAMSSKTKHWEAGKWVSKAPEFHWDSEKKGILLGAFFYGYLVLQIPGGWLCMKIGGKAVLGVAIFSASILNALLPVIIRFNEDLFFVARVTQGFCLGVVLPSNHFMWGKWAPSKEKATLVSFSISGISTGMLTSYPVSGFLCQYGFAGGWPSVFYVFGGMGIIWSITWYFLVAESPSEHKSISKEELALMDQLEYAPQKNDSIPWCRIFTSLPVLGIIIANLAFDCPFYIHLVTMPLFVRDVHKFTVVTTGLISAIPWLFMTFVMSTTGFLADKSLKYFSTGVSRKLFFNVGTITSGITIIATAYVESPEATIALLCLSVGLIGIEFSTFSVNAMDVASKYGGTIIGISNTVGTIPGFVGPYIVGTVTKHGTQAEWLKIFYGVAVIGVVGGIIYIIIGSGEVQPWADYERAETIELNEAIEDEESKTISMGIKSDS